MKTYPHDLINLITKLRENLTKWEVAYYSGHSLVSDEHYDAAYQELVVLETNYPELVDENSPTQRVGKSVVKQFLKTPHTTKMLSLNNAFADQDLAKFWQQCTNLANQPIDFLIEPKIDGSSISLIYQNQKLVAAISRGDGSVGENIISNVRTIRNVPLSLSNIPNQLEVRGEIYMTNADFATYQANLAASEQKAAKNPRNTVAGALRLQDSQLVAQKPLRFVAYQIINAHEQHGLLTQASVHEQLKAWGFPTLSDQYVQLVANLAEAKKFIDFFGQQKATYAIPCDGLVLKVNQLNTHELIGYTAKAPKWAIAYKYPANIQKTKLLAINATTGRTGKITYVAQLVPVNISGSTIENATLHNADYIISKDIRVNDVVSVYKAGEIIPKIIGPDLTLRTDDCVRWTIHTTCPTCASALVFQNDNVDQYCPNSTCLAQVLAQITHFCSRDAMNIVGLSSQIIQKLHQLALIHDVSDLYLLKNHQKTIINANLKIKDKLFNNLINAIEASKNQTLAKSIYALGINHVGARVAQMLADHFGSLTKIINATQAELEAISEIGPTIALAIVNWFAQTRNQKLIDKLIAHGLKFSHTLTTTNDLNRDHFLFQKKVVITGTLFLDRKTIANWLIAQFQCQIQSQVNKMTDYLICGEHPGSKFVQAQTLGTKIINNQTIKDLYETQA